MKREGQILGYEIMQIGISWCGHCLKNSLNISQASNIYSFSCCWNEVI